MLSNVVARWSHARARRRTATLTSPRDFVRSLDRGLAIIRVFDANHPELTLSEVARSAGISRATVRRCLHTLRDLGYVRTDGQLFTLSPKVLDLGYSRL